MNIIDELILWLRCKISCCLFSLNRYFTETGFINKNIGNKL